MNGEILEVGGDLSEFDAQVADAKELSMKILTDSDLLMVGGGGGDVVFG